MLSRLLRGLGRRFRRNAKGASALEFALIAPVMLTMFAGMVETGQAVLAQRRTSHAVAVLGDLASRTSSISNADRDDIFAAATDIMTPLATAGGWSMRLTSVTDNAQAVPKVDWSDVNAGSTFATLTPGTTFAGLPSGLLQAQGDTVVVAEVSYVMVPATTFVLPSGIVFTKRAYLRPRKGTVGRTP